jgi:transcriptional regulator with GAF, ATPase, and Fis domain
MMNNTMTWMTDQSPNLASGAVVPSFASTLHDERLNALRELIVLLLSEVESLQVDRPASTDGNAGLQNQVQRFESDLIRQALHRTGGNQARAARLLGVKPTTLNAKIRRYHIPLSDQLDESEGLVRQHTIAA